MENLNHDRLDRRQRTTSSTFQPNLNGQLQNLIENVDNEIRHENRQRLIENRLPDVVNSVCIRNQMGNEHANGRRSASINLPIDQDVIRAIGSSLRRISEEFELSARSREVSC